MKYAETRALNKIISVLEESQANYIKESISGKISNPDQLIKPGDDSGNYLSDSLKALYGGKK